MHGRCGADAISAPAGQADAVFINGKVYTADAEDSLVEGFAISADHFIATGTSSDMRKYIGAGTKVVDLKGHFVSPGLADDHFHNEGGGTGIDLSHVRSMPQLLTTIANAAGQVQPGVLLVSNSDWHEAQLREQRLPLAKELDQAAPNNPVVLVRGAFVHSQ